MMKLHLFKFIKKNNKGMSLVEAIIAVAILSVAVIPVLTVLSHTVRYNAVAKVKQRATNEAMSIMETYKAYGVEKATSMLGLSAVEGTTGQFTGTIKFNPADAKDYAVTVKYSPVEDASPGATYTTRLDDIEGTPFFDPKHDVVFMEAKNVNGSPTDPINIYDPYFYLRDLPERLSLESKDIKKVVVKRNIYIEIKMVGENPTVIVKYKFEGEYNGGVALPLYNPDHPGNLTTTSYTTPETTLSIAAGEDLNSIYFYYYPGYGHSATLTDHSVKVEDKIIINNEYANDLNVYLFKQKDGSIDNTKLITYESESNYKLIIANGIDGPLTDNTVNLYSVVNFNLGDNSHVSDILHEYTPTALPTDTKIIVHHGLTNSLNNEILSYNISIDITDPTGTGIFNSDPNLASLKGTIVL